jgi:hypothetical protein
MSLVRPEITALLRQWREVITAVVLALFGGWLGTRGGPVLGGLGGVIGVIGVALAIVGVRRARFVLAVGSPGLVEVDEGRISYMGPITGGAVALSELIELQVMMLGDKQRCWRLKQIDGQALLVPMTAAGAERLYDVFSTLPGISDRVLTEALRHDGPVPRILWRKLDQGRRAPVLPPS